ncbi:MAG: 30S ribosomal protein S11 [Parcubacteria group bacterium GW2011_GWB1_52_7]|nr:MAG: 30S ribosomal protein S11 [Parcubacteria group bacterium GW2011_GWA1_51_12]KKW28732.1 MAG: 30S ribosomal protein S11 [Parcubacteria group bacterium GW2011_GWB1_52_7]KKW30387.1 MAG: 30S ribosomal protein S11 [Parcubacteria group bacterium GW2011_GWC2_52_8c]
MGKKRVAKKEGEEVLKEREALEEKVSQMKQAGPGGGRHVVRGVAHVQATYNNTMISISDDKGNVLAWSSAGALGFKGAKKATPFAAARVAETVVEKVKKAGLEDVAVLVKGIGSGRDSAIRALANHGLNIMMIKDITPVPHNGPRPKKVRRV